MWEAEQPSGRGGPEQHSERAEAALALATLLQVIVINCSNSLGSLQALAYNLAGPLL